MKLFIHLLMCTSSYSQFNYAQLLSRTLRLVNQADWIQVFSIQSRAFILISLSTPLTSTAPEPIDSLPPVTYIKIVSNWRLVDILFIYSALVVRNTFLFILFFDLFFSSALCLMARTNRTEPAAVRNLSMPNFDEIRNRLL